MRFLGFFGFFFSVIALCFAQYFLARRNRLERIVIEAEHLLEEMDHKRASELLIYGARIAPNAHQWRSAAQSVLNSAGGLNCRNSRLRESLAYGPSSLEKIATSRKFVFFSGLSALLGFYLMRFGM
jgi:hypothetical protein